MGRSRRHSRSSSQRRCDPCSGPRGQRDAWKRNYNNILRQRQDWQRRSQSQFYKLKQLQELCGSATDIKKKAKEMFKLLENRYGDRLALIDTQQGYMNKMNHILEDRRLKVINNDTTLEEQNDKINTKNRKISHSFQDSTKKEKINKILRIIFLILALCVIAILVKHIRAGTSILPE